MGLHFRRCFACGGYHPSARPLRTRASEIHDFRSIAVPARCVTLPVAAHSRPNHPAFTSFPRTRQSTGFTGHDPEGRRPTSPSCWRSCTRRFRVDLGASAMVAQHWEVGALSAPVHVKSDAAASRGAIRSSRSTADGYYKTGICSSCSRRSSRHRRQAAAARRRRRRCHLHRQRLPAGPRGPFECVCRCPGRCLACLRCARACFLHHGDQLRGGDA